MLPVFPLGLEEVMGFAVYDAPGGAYDGGPCDTFNVWF
jgi:hypothetical protein